MVEAIAGILVHFRIAYLVVSVESGDFFHSLSWISDSMWCCNARRVPIGPIQRSHDNRCTVYGDTRHLYGIHRQENVQSDNIEEGC